MEPRSFKRGNGNEGQVAIVDHPGLQWSHVHSNVETNVRRGDNLQAALLQWSHVHSNVETQQRNGRAPARISLQWSHVHSNVETMYASGERAQLGDASMEPRSFKRGNSEPAWRARPRHGRFNGATFIQTWKLSPNGARLIKDYELQWSHVHSNVETL